MQNQVKDQVSAQFCRVFLYKAMEDLNVEVCPVTTAARGGTIRMARTYPWKVSDAFWERVKPLLPTAPSHANGGHPRMDDRRAFEAIVYILRTGIQWNALPKELGASSTVHDRFQGRIEGLRALLAQYVAHDERLEREVHQAEREYAQTKAREAEQRRELEHWQQQEQQAVSLLVEARAMSSFKRLFKGLRIETLEARVAQCGQKTYEIQQMLATLQPQIVYTQRTLVIRNEERTKSKQQVQAITEELHIPSEPARKIADLKSQKAHLEVGLVQITANIEREKAHIATEAQALIEQQADLETELELLDQQLRDVEKSIVEKALVVGTTLTKISINQTIGGRNYEAVILDEVSMAPMPLVYLAATHAERSMTLIGDPQQLAPIVTADKPMAQKWLGMDLFNLRNISLQAAKQNYQHSVLLDVQSRMHPAIASVANRLVYRGLLRDDFRQSGLKQITPLPAEPLVLCNTQDAYPIATRPANKILEELLSCPLLSLPGPQGAC